MKIVLLRFDAPLMSFGSVRVDQFNKTDLYPYRSMLVGLIANALGLTRDAVPALDSLQRRLRYAARIDRTGSVLVDYQTVDLGQPAMASELAWTAEGTLERRKGGGAADGTHIRFRHYVADSIITTACSLEDAEGEIGLDLVVAALRSPARPLFLGRKCCPPAVPVFLGTLQATSLREALETTPRVGARGDDDALKAIWPQSEQDVGPGWPRVEDRDWENSIHVGREMYVLGTVTPPPSTSTETGAAS